ncbi:hypothetical protein FE257_009515 [Aspergillus nanangensis]|uniref:Enoyl reductase (ER) domain-containing protein n=1 Tax=Aspergillus nanangensis TaxID=2582783 RepID=A0AAD4CJW4_ASPNN|nr:hypothetical protein FE257_009515 [Aspergillus nanangensis]
MMYLPARHVLSKLKLSSKPGAFFRNSHCLSNVRVQHLSATHANRQKRQDRFMTQNVMGSFSLKDRVVAITGGGQGIGLALAFAAAEAGAKVAILDVAAQPHGDFGKLKQFSGESRYYTADVTDYDGLEQAFQRVNEDFGGIHGCITAAGVCPDQPFLERPPESVKKCFDINVLGTFYAAQLAAKHMVTNRPQNCEITSSIVTIGSVAAHRASVGQQVSDYCASKGAVLALTRALAVELAEKNVRVNCISPGYIQTDMMLDIAAMRPQLALLLTSEPPMKRMGDRADLKGAAVYLLSQATVLHGAHDMRLETRPTTSPGPDEVQIRIRATGICGTDMHYYHSGKNGMFEVRQPLVLGHEAAGEIRAVGRNVTHEFQIGDRVAIEPQRPCKTCEICCSGAYNLCPRLKFTGSASVDPPIQGSLQELYNHPAVGVHKIPDTISFEEGALLEPLSVALHAVRRSGLTIGQSVLVLGAGAIGLLCASLARAAGASRVGIVDIDQSRLDFAMGSDASRKALATASYRIDLGKMADLKEGFANHIAQEIRQADGLGAADLVFECTGVESCVNIGINCTGPGGKVVLVGMGSPTQNLQIGAAAVREVDLLAVWRYANTFPTAIDLVQNGQVHLRPLITHTFELSRAETALETALAKPANLIKCVITS